MIAADTSRWVVFLEGGAGEDAQLLDRASRRVQRVGIVESFRVFTKAFRGWVQAEKGNAFTASP